MFIIDKFKLLVLITYLFSTRIQATYPTFHFNQKKYPLSQGKYIHYARPQLNNMRKEFYHIIQKFSFYSDQIVKTRELFFTKVYKLQNLENSCYQEAKCVEKVKNSYKVVQKINKQLLRLKEQTAKQLNTFNINDDYMAHFPGLLMNSLRLENILLDLLSSLRIETEESYLQTVEHEKSVKKLIFEVYHQFNYLMIDTLPRELKQEFEKVWFYFFRPLEKYILPAKTPKTFLDRVEALNLIWNTFHMKISKGEMRVPTNGHKIIITMHRRWVSILKLFLKK